MQAGPGLLCRPLWLSGTLQHRRGCPLRGNELLGRRERGVHLGWGRMGWERDQRRWRLGRLHVDSRASGQLEARGGPLQRSTQHTVGGLEGAQFQRPGALRCTGFGYPEQQQSAAASKHAPPAGQTHPPSDRRLAAPASGWKCVYEAYKGQFSARQRAGGPQAAQPAGRSPARRLLRPARRLAAAQNSTMPKPESEKTPVTLVRASA